MSRDPRGKLRRHHGAAAAAAAGAAAPTDLLRVREGRRRARGRVALPAGEEVEVGEHGCCWVRRQRYPLDHRHGALALGAALDVDVVAVAGLARSPGLEGLDPRQCLFLDTETTGLSGGAGTLVFNTGMGWFDGDAFVVEQTFLRCFSEERAALALVGERLAARPTLVTYVGKCFDRHRLAARMTLHHIAVPILTDRHLDLYYLARRAHGKRLPNVRLRTVEEQLLGVVRDDDLPGSEAPAAFLDWIRDGTGPVDRVLEHNRLDVLSLVTLLACLGA